MAFLGCPGAALGPWCLVTSAERPAERPNCWPCSGRGLVFDRSDFSTGGWPGALAPTQRRRTAALLGPGTLAGSNAEQLGAAAASLLQLGWPRSAARGGLLKGKRSLPNPGTTSNAGCGPEAAGSPSGTFNRKPN